VAFKAEKNSWLETASCKYRVEKEEMVFVEEKFTYLQKFEEGNDFSFLREFLQNKKVESLKEESSLAHKLLFSLASDDISSINEIIKDYSAKSPNPESPYIYKDLQIFLFICATKKFALPNEWLLNFVKQRKSEEEEINFITRTFENLLKDNLESKDNYFEIVIVYKDILGIEENNESILNSTYERLSKKSFPFYERDFLNLIAIRAIDLIIFWKGLDDYAELKTLKIFARKFDYRIHLISEILSWIFIISFFGVGLYFAAKLILGTQEESQFYDKLLTALGFIGLTVTGVGKKRIKEFIEKNLKKLFGRSI
jgi:hypothetical protein